ncbi:MAG: hypothetical protein LBU75_15445 [Desulfovibrio sp.]|jgi:hypothetical protein|nr:hypothetical protein [Desulfovibrio sp.]
MPIDGWLEALPGQDAGAMNRHVADDVALFAGRDHPLLSTRTVRHQVARLSAHLLVLGATTEAPHPMDDGLRRALLGYSLYTRQLDMVQDRATKHICRDGCERPPLGCCNRSHNVVFSLSDIMMQHPTGLALRMGDALARLQAEEGAHHAHGAPMGERGCPYLTATGCTLYLFKSPLCVHYLCPTVADALDAAHGPEAAPFVAGMRRAANRQLERSSDFMEPGLIEAAVRMFAPEGRSRAESGDGPDDGVGNRVRGGMEGWPDGGGCGNARG